MHITLLPCGKKKRWDVEPEAGALPAGEVYTGTLHQKCRKWAEAAGTTPVILSARYGFLFIGESIPGNYDQPFPSDRAVTVEQLIRQAEAMQLDCAEEVHVLLGKKFHPYLREVFPVDRMTFPLEGGRGIGDILQTLEVQIETMLKRKQSMKPILPSNPSMLIVGSMPGEKSLEHQKYYAHPRNHFWPIISAWTGEPLMEEAYERKIRVLQEHGAALWDVIQSCERSGSLDAAIKNEEVNDIEHLLQRFPGLRRIGCNGGKAYSLLRKHIHIPDHVDIMQLPSTSPIPGKNVKSFDEKLAVWLQFLTNRGF
ncbi:DNA-deoxyinosine glycosylase [Alkalicoccus chagannorensis]|uniref:DNA-deoxyinosine glycosylase n=1 Tax=Alkalicoccus chagannorensis TaxID=427072 RepID=UPI000401F0CF|nr:DNA-deoxyinosine glycosylase [Alkalicoccus chagannorensis]